MKRSYRILAALLSVWMLAAFCLPCSAAGGDTYYAFASAEERFDTGLPLDEVLMDYITSECGGTVGSEYKTAQGRIRIRLGFGDRIRAFFLNVWSSIKNFFTGLVYKAGAFFSSLFGKNG